MDRFAPLTLRPFAEGDTDAVVSVIRSCYEGYGEQIELETLDADLLAIPEKYGGPGSAFWVLTDGDEVVGTVAVKAVDPPEEGELKRVFLRESYRGRGLGKKLSLFAFDWAREQGYQRLHIWSDVLYETAHALYRKLGATETGETRFIGGVNECWEKYFILEL